MDLPSFMLCLLMGIILVEAQRDKSLYCSVCRAMVEEINYSISQVDPKRTVKTGSFRVDPKGNQAIKEVPYARSDSHLAEVIEEVCNRMNDYAQMTDDDGKKSIVRTSSRNGKPLSLKNIKINREIQQQLKFYCESIIEDHEDNLIGLFKRESMPNIDRVICGEIATACTESELNEPLPTLKAEEEAEELDSDEEETEKDKEAPEPPKEEPKQEESGEEVAEEKPKEEL